MKKAVAAIMFMLGFAGVYAQDTDLKEWEMVEINVSDHVDHIFTNFIVEYPQETGAEWEKIFREDVLSRVEKFFAEENPEMDLQLSASDSLEASLKKLSRSLIAKAEQLTAADASLWQYGFDGERYFFNFSLQVEAIPLEGSEIMSFHLMASEFKPWGKQERDVEAWCCYDMQTGRKLGLRDIVNPEGFPKLRDAIEQFVVAFQVGEEGRGLLVRNCDKKIALPEEYNVALVDGALRYCYSRDELIRDMPVSGIVPIGMLQEFLTPIAKKALGF